MHNGDVLEAVKFRYFLVISLILHVILLFLFRLNLEHKANTFKPTYVQLVDLPSPIPPSIPFIGKRIELPQRQRAMSNETRNANSSRINEPIRSPSDEISRKPVGKPIEETGKAVTGDVRVPGRDVKGSDSQNPQGYGSPSGHEGSGKGIRGLPLMTDKDLEKFAKVEEPSITKKEKSITLDTDEFKYVSYLERLKYRIEYIWRYPEKARIERLQGDLYIRFSIHKDGRLGSVQVLRSSGYDALDQGALQALKDSDPFWPLPDNWELDEFTITGHFIYYLGGLYLR